MTIALVVAASDDVTGSPDGHCAPSSAAVSVGGISFTFKPSCGIVSGGGMISGAGFLASRGGRVLGGVTDPVLYGIMRLKCKKLVNKSGVIGGVLGNGPEVLMPRR